MTVEVPGRGAVGHAILTHVFAVEANEEVKEHTARERQGGANRAWSSKRRE